VDFGNADAEVQSGDWAVIHTRELDLPALHADTSYAYEFASPIFRMGNDYSKGIILATGYVGERTSNGLVTCLTDGVTSGPAPQAPSQQVRSSHRWFPYLYFAGTRAFSSSNQLRTTRISGAVGVPDCSDACTAPTILPSGVRS